MPIDYNIYPPNWDQIRQRILVRAKWKCECCNLLNYSQVSSFKVNGKTVWEVQDYEVWMRAGCPKRVKVVLTIAHLDHDEENHNVTDDRLKAMCQLCHLRYDVKEKQKRKKSKKMILQLEIELRSLNLEKSLLLSEIDCLDPEKVPIEKLRQLAILVLKMKKIEKSIFLQTKNLIES